MITIKEKQDLACVQYSELSNTDIIEKQFFAEPNRIVYVLNHDKLSGIITLGDFKRNYPETTLAVNPNGRKLINSSNVQQEAQELFASNSKIKKVPVVNDADELMFEISSADVKEDYEEPDLTIYLEDTEWFTYYVEKIHCKRICIIEKGDFGLRLKDKIKNTDITIDIVAEERFSREMATQYDLIIEADLLRYERRRELLRRISRKFTNLYTSPEDMKFFRKAAIYYNEQKEKGVEFFIFEAPSEEKLTHMTDKQKARIKENRFWPYYYKTPDRYEDEFSEMFGTKDFRPMIDNIFKLPVPIKKGNTVFYEEYRSEYCNVTGGYRITLNKEWSNYKHDIDMYGPCAVFGLFVEDKDTIASNLQDMCNKSDMKEYNVNNFGIRASDVKEMVQCMFNKKHSCGDAVVFLMMAEEIGFFRQLDPDIKIIELSEVFNQEKDLGLFFIDKPIHCNYKASRIIAREMFKTLTTAYAEGLFDKSNLQKDIKQEFPAAENSFEDNEELKEYLEELMKIRIESSSDNIGAIVMNCNPFTNGHRYLIETAASQVEQLYIFVVEENKSFFKFEDRIKLVKAGTADLKNVTVLPSGKFIISSITFPEYFQKDDKQEVTIDTSLDIEVFAQYIAPALKVKRRFVGEEPIDLVTRQYNESMKRLLPDYGITVTEIPRKSYDDVAEGTLVISASRVRKYMKEDRWDEIKRIVPSTTYDFLVENFKH